MNKSCMPSAAPYRWFLAPRLREALGDILAVLLHGRRQSGKTTLARCVSEAQGYRYVSFDDDATLAAARYDPVGFVARLPASTILHEVPRIPEHRPVAERGTVTTWTRRTSATVVT